VEDARALQARARAGESFVFFPEGTFGRASGLQAFKLGAFIVATATETPLVPVTLNGTRSLLRDDSWWPRRCQISVTFGAPLKPAGTGWDSALALREAARQAIAAQLAEPVAQT
jgi:1-acyl-sn-glycerol-3-phosphate acyltransferase